MKIESARQRHAALPHGHAHGHERASVQAPSTMVCSASALREGSPRRRSGAGELDALLVHGVASVARQRRRAFLARARADRPVRLRIPTSSGSCWRMRVRGPRVHQRAILQHVGRPVWLGGEDYADSHPSLRTTSRSPRVRPGIVDDGDPAHIDSACRPLLPMGSRWRTLAQSMPSACDHMTTNVYAARHNPAIYFTAIDASCQRDDVPLTYP